MKKLLLFGGAFNPPHEGHMRLLASAIDYVKPDMTMVVPTSVSPHKVSGDISFSHRFNMAKVFKSFSKLRLSGVENRGRKRKNYTIETLKWCRKRYKNYEIYLLMGSDMLTSFTTWSRYRKILSLATLVVASREESDIDLEEAIKELTKEGARIHRIYFDPLVISSSELRKAIAEGKDVSRYLDVSVVKYIDKHKLYAAGN